MSRRKSRKSYSNNAGGTPAAKDEAILRNLMDEKRRSLERQRNSGNITDKQYGDAIANAQRESAKMAEEASMYIDSLLALFSRVNTVIAGTNVDCFPDSSGISGGVACTDGKRIYFSVTKLFNWYQALKSSRYNMRSYHQVLRAITDFRGINYHELAHIVYTPNIGALREVIHKPYGDMVRWNDDEALFWQIPKTTVRSWLMEYSTPELRDQFANVPSVANSTSGLLVATPWEYDTCGVFVPTHIECAVILSLHERDSRGLMVANAKFNPSITKLLNNKKRPFWLPATESASQESSVTTFIKRPLPSSPGFGAPKVLKAGKKTETMHNSSERVLVAASAHQHTPKPLKLTQFVASWNKYEKYWQSRRNTLSAVVQGRVVEFDQRHINRALGLHAKTGKFVEYNPNLGLQEQQPAELTSKVEHGNPFYAHEFRQAAIHRAWNLLEDQRIETLMVAKYPPVRHYFTAAVMEHLIGAVRKSSSQMQPRTNEDFMQRRRVAAQIWLFIYGRRYLPWSLIAEARKEFQECYGATDEQMTELELIIDTYRSAPISRTKGWLAANGGGISLLLVRLLEIVHFELGVPFMASMSTSGSPFDFDKHDPQEYGSAPTDSQISEALKKVAENDDAQKAQEEEKKSGGGSADGDEDEDGDADGSAGGEDAEDESDSSTSGSAPLQPDDSDSDSADSGDGDDDGDGDGDGDGSSDSTKESQDDATTNAVMADGVGKSGTKFGDNPDFGQSLIKHAESVLNGANESLESQAQEIMATVSKRVEKIREDNLFHNPSKPTRMEAVSSDWRMMSASLRQALRQLQSYRENDWVRGSNSGTVNIGTYIDSRGLHTDFFDEWVDDGDIRPDCEVVILMDCSGSMDGQMEDACTLLWAIKNACQDNEIPCSAFMYDTDYSLVCAPDDRMPRQEYPLFSSGGGTEPSGLLKLVASYLVRVSDAKHKILFSVTDGAWGEAGYQNILAGMNDAGVETILLQLPRYSLQRYGRIPESNLPQNAFSPLPKNNYGHSRHIKCGNIQSLGAIISKVLVKGVKNH